MKQIAKRRTFLLTLILVFVLIGLTTAYFSPKDDKLRTLKVGNNRLKVEIADTREEITTGLSNRANLPANQGMYFVLRERKVRAFWMKAMLFQLDIIWIDSDKIVGIEKNAPIPSGGTITTYTSPTVVTAVLEVNAGYAESHQLTVGDKVELLR